MNDTNKAAGSSSKGSESGAEDIDGKIRLLLRSNDVKLWLEPFTKPDGSGNLPESLVLSLSVESGIEVQAVAESLERLRVHAVNKLASKRQFDNKGIASFVVNVLDSDSLPAGRLEFYMSIDETVSTLAAKVAQLRQMAAPAFRLISSGRILEDAQRTLRQMNFGACNEVLCILMSQQETEEQQTRSYEKQVSKTKEAAEILISRRNRTNIGRQGTLEITDQQGNLVTLPAAEEKALTIALALHEMGRAELKRENFSKALIFCLEAEGELEKCSERVLNMVDNVGLLYLDIVWCYLCLQSVQALPDAERRLIRCEECFNKSYGLDLERVRKIKKSVHQEQVFIIRLRLLQGILQFHKGQFGYARQLLRKAEQGVAELKVDDEKLCVLMNMGYTARESRLALRQTCGNLEASVTHILQEHADEAARREAERRDQEDRRRAERLGRTVSGQWLNATIHDSLVNMGFPADCVRRALAEADNAADKALDVLMQRRTREDELDPAALAQKEKEVRRNLPLRLHGGSFDGFRRYPQTVIVSLGFAEAQARAALANAKGDVDQALASMMSTRQPSTSTPTSPNLSADESGSAGSPRTSSTQKTSSTSSTESHQGEDWTNEERDAFRLVAPDLAHRDRQEYLDTTLEAEANWLAQYKSRIEEQIGKGLSS